MKKALKIIVSIILLIAFVGIIGLSFYTGLSVFQGMTNFISREKSLENQSYYIDEYNAFASKYNPIEVMVPSSQNDCDIPAVYVEKADSKGVAVLIHGMGGTRKSLVHMMQSFLDLGYSVIAYDQRNAGENTAPYSTFGVLESVDALDVVKYAHENLLNSGKLILWGESYGGATAAIAMGRDESNIDYLILECPVGKGLDMIKTVSKEYADEAGIPLSYMLFCGELYTRLKLGFNFKDMDPAMWLKSTSKPVLISNSSIDTITPAYIGTEIYEAISHDRKQIVTSNQYEHTEFPIKDPKGYQQMVKEFIDAY